VRKGKNMTILDSEMIRTAELLFKLADRMRDEQRYPAHPSIAGTLRHTVIVIEAAASATALGRMTLEDADAIADSGELTLRKIIGLRKLRDAAR
jgi:hypothetical protein